ncbi:L-lactate dehydrogenase [Spiroplasma clarkii]|uniref:L-lactate dehydrogenase n=1 Tax=Spiroplasma clarkii TaxID=2139 RepID=A0A1Y0L2P8_9MOLU|nr:L-lactate dehydrogenase [Spiroplasma clarkii]ARU92291.1 L-lactate dehydrogenase [Spiroplasma clarkii]ATX71599.1 L-lactate dehydrogenase [Spiroplasma clarkii]
MISGRKIVLIGCGAVGTSFVYSAINQGIAQHYVLIDVNEDVAEGNVIDLSDSHSVLPKPFSSMKVGNYQDCSDADVVVITAGRPQKTGESRLDMIKDNAKIMKEIGLQVKGSGFSGITLIASNPVDILIMVYQKVTGFEPNKVISSGTTLDSSRLRKLLGEKLGVAPKSVKAYLLGEHGDSSVAIWSRSVVMGKTIDEYVEEGKISRAELESVRDEAANLAYEIIELKRATYYGIGACLTRIVDSILEDSKLTLMVGAYLNGEYGQKGIYISVPCVIGSQGIEQVIEWKLEPSELEGIQKSCDKLRQFYNDAKSAFE